MIKQLPLATQLQLGHIGLSSIWNVAGVVLLSIGTKPLGPTASLTLVLLLLTLAVGLIFSVSRQVWIYLFISLFLLWGAGSSVFNAVSGDPTGWLSEFWRYFGIAINTLGVVANLLAAHYSIHHYLKR